MNQFAQTDMVVAILAELERQLPGVSLTQRQFDAIVRAADLIIAAMNAPATIAEDRAA